MKVGSRLDHILDRAVWKANGYCITFVHTSFVLFVVLFIKSQSWVNCLALIFFLFFILLFLGIHIFYSWISAFNTNFMNSHTLKNAILNYNNEYDIQNVTESFPVGTGSGRETMLYMVAAILRTCMLPVCSSILIDEYPVPTRLVN